MNSSYSKIALAEVTHNLLYGEFIVAINNIEIHRDGLELHITWTVKHLDCSHTEVSVIHWDEPLLLRFGYTPEDNDIDKEGFAETLLSTLNIEVDKIFLSITFNFLDGNMRILPNHIHWESRHKRFM